METKAEILKDLEETTRDGTGKVWSENPLNRYPNYKKMTKDQLIFIRNELREENIKLLISVHQAYLEQIQRQ